MPYGEVQREKNRDKNRKTYRRSYEKLQWKIYRGIQIRPHIETNEKIQKSIK